MYCVWCHCVCWVDAEADERDYIVLSARVHPGESNSSWVMKGIHILAVDSLVFSNTCKVLFVPAKKCVNIFEYPIFFSRSVGVSVE